MADYVTTVTDPHERDEEQQWARMLAAGDAAAGMLLVFVQKLCTAVHEFDPAYRAGGLKEEKLDFFRGRLATRTEKVLDVMNANGMRDMPGAADLREMLERIRDAELLGDLADLAEPVHQVNHTICDALSERTGT